MTIWQALLTGAAAGIGPYFIGYWVGRKSRKDAS